jgi:hypothetical protein
MGGGVSEIRVPIDSRCRQPVILSPLSNIRLLDWIDMEGFGTQLRGR